jgi:hypothetical protein
MYFKLSGADCWTRRAASVDFDHWGAAEGGLQLGVIERVYAACRNPAAWLIALIVSICV